MTGSIKTSHFKQRSRSQTSTALFPCDESGGGVRTGFECAQMSSRAIVCLQYLFACGFILSILKNCYMEPDASLVIVPFGGQCSSSNLSINESP